MDDNFVAKQLESYSNAIVGFMAVQSLGYSYYFATDCHFNHLVKNAPWLAEGLTFMLSLVAGLAIWGIFRIRSDLYEIAGEYGRFFRKLYWAKAIAAGVFGALPIAVTVGYAILTNAPLHGCD